MQPLLPLISQTDRRLLDVNQVKIEVEEKKYGVIIFRDRRFKVNLLSSKSGKKDNQEQLITLTEKQLEETASKVAIMLLKKELLKDKIAHPSPLNFAINKSGIIHLQDKTLIEHDTEEKAKNTRSDYDALIDYLNHSAPQDVPFDEELGVEDSIDIDTKVNVNDKFIASKADLPDLDTPEISQNDEDFMEQEENFQEQLPIPMDSDYLTEMSQSEDDLVEEQEEENDDDLVILVEEQPIIPTVVPSPKETKELSIKKRSISLPFGGKTSPYAQFIKAKQQDGTVEPREAIHSSQTNYYLMWGSKYGIKEVVEKAIKDKSVDLSTNNYFALETAKKNGHKEITDLLLTKAVNLPIDN